MNNLSFVRLLFLFSLCFTFGHSQSGIFDNSFGQVIGNGGGGGGGGTDNDGDNTATTINDTDSTNNTTATVEPTDDEEETTMSPTASSTVPLPTAPVSGTVTLQLIKTPSLLIGESETAFLHAIDSFLLEAVTAGIDEDSTLTVTQVGILRQYRQSNRRLSLTMSALVSTMSQLHRSLQDDDTAGPLYVDLQIVGNHTSPRGAGELDMDALLTLLFTTFSEDFISILHQEGENLSFFDSVTKVQVIDTTPSPTISPTTTTGAGGIPSKDDSSGNKDGFWSLGTMVGIAAAGAVTLLLLLVIICRLTSGKKDVPPSSTTSPKQAALSGSSILTDLETPTGRGAKGKSKETSRPRRNKNESRQSSADKKKKTTTTKDAFSTTSSTQSHHALLEQTSDLESQGLYSYVKNESDSVTGSSIMQNSVYGNDDMSYTYSLQAGLEPSVAPGYSMDQSSIRISDRKVPTEIPQISIPTKTTQQKSNNNNNKRGVSMSTDFEDSLFEVRTMEESHEVQLSPSDLRLTESDLALLPSNLRDSFEEKSRTTTPLLLQPPTSPPSPFVPSPPKITKATKPTTRIVMAPPGKLGIVIDTTIDGPVVHHVNKVSTLKGKLFPGDIIIAIDNVDTRAMSASAITALMVKTAQQKRKLTVIPVDSNKK